VLLIDVTMNYKFKFAILVLGIVIGTIAGIVLNYLWYLFLVLIIGWGDSSPEWYVEIHNIIFYLIIVLSIVLCSTYLQIRYYHSMRKGKGVSP
jgi:hypothetical protein